MSSSSLIVQNSSAAKSASQSTGKSATETSFKDTLDLVLGTESFAKRPAKGKTAADEAKNLRNETLIIFCSQSSAHKKAGTEGSNVIVHHSPEVQAFLQTAIEEKSITGKLKEVVLFREAKVSGFRNLVVAGVGSNPDHESLRQLGGSLAKMIHDSKHSRFVASISLCPWAGKEDFLRGLAEGMRLGSYQFKELKSKPAKTEESAKKEDQGPKTLTILVASLNQKNKAALQEAKLLSQCVNFSKRLGDLPGNFMTPTILADTAEKAAKGTGIKFAAWGPERLKKERMGGLLGVSQGSEQEPRFIIMEYNGSKKKDAAPIVFVGKGLTFDTGGISIKPGASMEEMKYDMCGGANVIGAILAIARLKLKVNAVALIPASENMPSGKATKPGDVHTARNGKTFEVNNTDAEGRLILADALSYGSELKPRMMVDAATLTGAIVVALGNTHTGFFTRDEALAKKITEAGADSGEWVWRMPLTDFHLEDMKGNFADLNNISNFKGAGSSTAAAFLEQFVEKGIPWAHFDIAGTAWAVGNRLSYCNAKGASGAIVRTFVELAKSFED